jgi:hypothetical protein
MSALCAAMVGAAAAFLAPAGADEGLIGHWAGDAHSGEARFELAVVVEQRGDALAGTIDWPAMGYLGVDLLGILQEPGMVRFSLPLPIGALHLRGIRDGEAITGSIERIDLVDGVWVNSGPAGGFELRRTIEPARPYEIREVSIASGGVTLSGSIFLPLTQQTVPGVVFIAGSGDATRGDGSFLADRLARQGIAALVYDKRGSGLSGGDWRSGGFGELAADAGAALQVLRAEPRIDPARVGFVCQSQGCWVAPIALRAGAPARFLVAQSGPAVSVADEDLDHYRVALERAGFTNTDVQEAFDLVRTDQSVSLRIATFGELEARMTRYRTVPWFDAIGFEARPPDHASRAFDRQTLLYDPGDNIDAIRVPSLWIFGAEDQVIPVAASITAVRDSQAVPAPEIIVLPDAGHSFTRETGAFPVLAGDYPGLVADWITAL